MGCRKINTKINHRQWKYSHRWKLKVELVKPHLFNLLSRWNLFVGVYMEKCKCIGKKKLLFWIMYIKGVMVYLQAAILMQGVHQLASQVSMVCYWEVLWIVEHGRLVYLYSECISLILWYLLHSWVPSTGDEKE